MELLYNGCGAPQCVYSNTIVEAAGVPAKSNAEDIDQWSEGGHICGSRISDKGKKFCAQRKLVYGDNIEPPYYNHLGGEKARNTCNSDISVTDTIGAMYCSFKDVLSDDEIKEP